MPGGTAWLIAVLILILFGWGDTFLKSWRLSRRAAVWGLALWVAASLWNITIADQPSLLVINAGGAILPLMLFVWFAASRLDKRLLPKIFMATAGGSVLLLWGMELIPQLQLSLLALPPGYIYGLASTTLAWGMVQDDKARFWTSVLSVVIADGARFLLLALHPDGTVGWWGGNITFDSLVAAGLSAVLVEQVQSWLKLRIWIGHDRVGDPT
mgnify:CR=1 FL=1